MIDKYNQEQKEKLESIKVEDGINMVEAEVLSSEYFSRYVSGCGMTGKPMDEGDYWSSIAYFGYAGVPLDEKIRIDKKTGSIAMKGYPTVDNPLIEWKIIP